MPTGRARRGTRVVKKKPEARGAGGARNGGRDARTAPVSRAETRAGSIAVARCGLRCFARPMRPGGRGYGCTQRGNDYRWEITYPGSESERGEAGEGGLAGLLNLLDESGLGGGALDRGTVANGVKRGWNRQSRVSRGGIGRAVAETQSGEPAGTDEDRCAAGAVVATRPRDRKPPGEPVEPHEEDVTVVGDRARARTRARALAQRAGHALYLPRGCTGWRNLTR